jgi:hypothetical protein
VPQRHNAVPWRGVRARFRHQAADAHGPGRNTQDSATRAYLALAERPGNDSDDVRTESKRDARVNAIDRPPAGAHHVICT